MQNVTYIYWLRDPGTQEVVYLGKTRNPIRREYEHCRVRREHPERVRRIILSGNRPIFQIVEIVPGGGWREERKWIFKLREFGHPICNSLKIHPGPSEGKGTAHAFRKSRWQIRCEKAKRIKEQWRRWYDSLSAEQKSEYQRKKLDNGGKEKMIAAQVGRKLPRERVERSAAGLRVTLNRPEVKEKLRKRRTVKDSMTAEEWKEFCSRRWQKAKDSGRTGFIKVVP